MKVIDLCIVATLRPEILKRTLSSFIKHVKFDGVININTNIDYVPENHQLTPETAIGRLTMDSVIRDFMRLSVPHYTNRTITNKVGNFAKAVKTLWKITEADYVFHLEDDWEFIRDIDLNVCIDMMKKNHYTYIRFPKINAPHLNCLHKVALQPSFWNGDCLRVLAEHLSVDKDPEKQLRPGQGNDFFDQILHNWYDKSWLKDYCSEWCCKDIGREWRDQNGLKKWNAKEPKTGVINQEKLERVTWYE